MIDYDSYGAIEDWLDNVEDDDTLNPLNTSHPIGELKDYDPDHQVLTPISVVERLEAAAAKLEALHGEQESDCKDALSLSSLSFRSSYGYLPSDSLENEPLVSEPHTTNPESAVGTETAPAPSSQVTSDDSTSQYLTVPPPAYTARERQSKPRRQGRKRYTMPRLYSYSDMDNLNEGLSIDRGLSPVPRIRRWNSSRLRPSPSLASSTFQPIPELDNPVSSEKASSLETEAPTRNAPSQFPAQPNPRLRISKCRQTPSPEILAPVPQRVGQLLIPGLSRTQFVASPFANSKGHNEIQVPALVVEQDENGA